MQKTKRIPFSKDEINQRFGKTHSSRKDQYVANALSTIGKVLPAGIKLLSGASMITAGNYAYEMAVNGSAANGTSLVAGLSAYAMLKYAQGKSGSKILKAMSDSPMNELTKYDSPAEDPDKMFTSEATRAIFRKLGEEIKMNFIESSKRLLSIIPSLNRKFETSFIADDDASRALFLFQILSDLDNDNSAFAKRLKENRVFKSAEIIDALKESHKFSNLITKQVDSTKAFGQLMAKSLGKDAKFILKDFTDYNKGKKEWFMLDLDAFESAIKSTQNEYIALEFGYRAVDIIAKATSGTLYGAEKVRAIQRLREFSSDGIKFNNSSEKDKLADISHLSEKLIDAVGRLSKAGKVEDLGDIVNRRLGNDKIDFKKIIYGNTSDKKQLKHDASKLFATKALNRSGKNYDFDTPFKQKYIDAFLKKIDEKIKVKLDKDLSTSNLESLPNHLLKKRLEDYELSDLEYLNPNDARSAVMNRIKTRLYYEINKDNEKTLALDGVDNYYDSFNR